MAALSISVNLLLVSLYWEKGFLTCFVDEIFVFRKPTFCFTTIMLNDYGYVYYLISWIGSFRLTFAMGYGSASLQITVAYYKWVLFCLILYAPVNSFQSCWDESSCVEPELVYIKSVLLKDNTKTLLASMLDSTTSILSLTLYQLRHPGTWMAPW